VILFAACTFTSSEMQIVPGSAMPASRAGMLRPSPRRSPLSPTKTSPIAMPIRNRSLLDGSIATFRSLLGSCMSIAQRVPSTALSSSARMVSPAVLNLNTWPNIFAPARESCRGLQEAPHRVLLFGSNEAAITGDVRGQDDGELAPHVRLATIAQSTLPGSKAHLRQQSQGSRTLIGTATWHISQNTGAKRRELYCHKLAIQSGRGAGDSAAVCRPRAIGPADEALLRTFELFDKGRTVSFKAGPFRSGDRSDGCYRLG
jgi:hypothetical protein